MFFDELSNDEWARLSALVSDEPAVRLNRRGRPRAEPRIVANAVLWILTTGEPWSKLPGRYPSGPTCRRRFEEWQANGTLIEMVRLLSETGRAFAYVPEPTPPAVAKPAPEVEQPKPRDDAVRGVYWKSPESWQATGGAAGVTNGWRPLGAMADITRQLAGTVDTEPFADEIVPSASADSRDEQTAGEAQAARPASAVHAHAQHGMLDASDELDAQYGAVYEGASFDEPRFDGSRFDGHASYGHLGGARAFDGHPFELHAGETERAPRDAAFDGEWHHSHQSDPANHHAPLWMNLAMPGGAQFDDERGYVIYVVAEQVASVMYRAWAEIMKDGRRVERSGLIGPRFEDGEAARRFALEWAIEWIDRECGALAGHAMAAAGEGGTAVAERAHASQYASVNATTVSAQQTVAALHGNAQAVAEAAASGAPVTRPMPESAAAKNAVPGAANRNGNGGNGGGNGAAQPSGPSSYPQHVNARVQLRRYPSENSSSADKTTDRFPPTRKFLSHVR
jgi:transposase